LEKWAYRFLFERLQDIVREENKQKIESGQTPEFGLMIIDSIHPKYDKILRQKLLCFLRDGTMFVDNEYIIEDPLFTHSHWRNLSQLIDCVAFCIGRNERGSMNEYTRKKFSEYYSWIKTKFHNKNGKVEGRGIKRFP